MGPDLNNDVSFSGFVMPEETVATNHFSEIEVIYRGQFNVIAKAKRYGRWWILKGLKPEFQDQQSYQNLLHKEFDILISMQHQSIVVCTGMESVNGLGQCIIMEWVDGVTLKEWLQTPHSTGDKQRITIQLLDVIEYIHSKQTAHRDLKPSNIMVTRNGNNVKLIDFGLSDTDDFAIYKQPAGTTGYISPEQENSYITDVRNDIYSLGCILSDLNPIIYHRIIKKCKAPAQKRYKNISDVRKAINRVLFLKKATVITPIVIIFFCLTFYFISRPSMIITEELQKQIVYNGYVQDVDGEINGHQYVDLGLPSGTKWATCNVGGDNPEDWGYYVAWGENKSKDLFTLDASLTHGKDIGDISGNPKYDVATAKWGGDWRTPTSDEQKELINNCTAKWKTINGKRGVIVTSKINGKSIFLPAAGWLSDGKIHYDMDRTGSYRSSTPTPNEKMDSANYMYFFLDQFSCGAHCRHDGRSVRAVTD